MAEAKLNQPPATPLLEVNNIEVVYHKFVLVLKGLSLKVGEGQIVAVLGNNGAGKTTTLKAISGLLKSEDGEVTDGQILFKGGGIDRRYPEDLVRIGIFQVMEGRRVFEDMTVEENLIAGGHTVHSRRRLKEKIEMVYAYFPRLKQRRNVLAGYGSGGEQQMLVIGRGLMASPCLMLLDEPSMGLAPMLVAEIFEIIQRINREERVGFCWSSRMPAWRSASPTMPTSWKTAASCWTTPSPRSAKMPT